ncbi:MAG: hypothetical protein ABJ227_17510 [Nitratireductor sp.]
MTLRSTIACLFLCGALNMAAISGAAAVPVPAVPGGVDETAQRGKPVDCHRDARFHRVPGAGRIYHRHVGQDCRIRIIRRSGEPAIGD